jgi:hypothetical protein
MWFFFFLFFFSQNFQKVPLTILFGIFLLQKNGEFLQQKIKSLVETLQQIVYSKEQSFCE